MIGITGRERMVSTIVASTRSSAPSSPADRLDQRRVRLRVADEALPGPGEGVRGRLVAGEHQGEELVAQFFVVERLALLGPRLQQQREDVAALLEVGRPAPLARSPRRSAGRASPRPSFSRPIGSSRPTCSSSVSWAVGQVEAATVLRIARPQRRLRRPRRGLALDAEDPGHDHVERDRLHPRRQRHRLADRPVVDLPLGRLR